MKDIFKFYCNYKLLTIDKNSDNISDEMYSLLAYIIFLYRKGFDKTFKINVNEEENNLKMNKMNIYKIEDNTIDKINFSISNDDLGIYAKNNFNNLIILYHNKTRENFKTNDIINLETLKNNSDVKIKIGKDHEEIILYPSGKIIPIIFYYSKSNSQIIENNIPIKLNKKIYTYNYLYKSNYFNEPFCLNNKGDAFYVLNEDRQKYVWLNYVTNIDDKIPKIKTNFQISYLYADYKNCFVIDFNGNLYGLGDNTYNQISQEKNNFIKFFTKIPLPDNCKKFIKCVCGVDYILCLIQENEGKYKIYAKGNNEKFQCGIPGIKLVTVLTKCKFNEDIEINDIFSNEYFSSAITTDYK